MTSRQPSVAEADPVRGVAAAEFRQAMGRFLTGVAVVTSCGPEGPHGTTVSSLASVSLEPPMLLICLGRLSSGAEVIRRAGTFTVNILGREQSELAGWFATTGRPRGAAGFAGVAHRTGGHGAPVLTGAVAHLECRVVQDVHAGDHIIFIGEVGRIGCAEAADPLAYHQGRFLTLG
ncbi:flavin reductase family protein [Streptomyces sp. CAU 1734]|uniref:flavin reductase family protein n=1 Tax=Streptomyces sp. CAU 1734 TaxID=3140360 RepID=UPI003261A565